MTINTNMRLSILAAAFALVVAAPAALAQGSGTWVGGTHTDPATNEGVSARHSKDLMQKKVAAPGATAQDSGTWVGDIHTDPATNEGVGARHSKALMQKKVVSGAPAGNQVEKSIELKDGSTVYFYKDGKMGMEDKYGRAIYMEPGHVMEAKDGKKIIMIGNELWRVDQLLSKYRIGG